MVNGERKYLFEKFEIIDCLKKDIHTSVYLANHVFLGKKIILKTLDTENLSDSTIPERFKREAKVLAKLDHPNLIKVLDFGMYNNFFYISFEYFESRNLRSVIKENNLSIEEKVNLIEQIFLGLNFAHKNQIIHRDIKPENILIDSRNRVKIADFGLALAEEETLITSKSSIVGTPSYMSPEQIRGEKLTPQSDLFSAGIVAYEIFTGTNPFVGKDINSTINNILQFDDIKLHSGLAGTSDPHKSIIKNLLERNLDKRIKSAEDVLNILGIEEEKIIPTKINSKKVFIYSAVAVLMLILSFSVWNVFLKNKSDSQKIDQENADLQPIERNDSAGFLQNAQPNQSQKMDRILPTESIVKENEEKKKVADIVSTDEPKITHLPGRLFVECSPWAEVFIDSQRIDITPLKDLIRLVPGEYELTLAHPDFPHYSKKIKIISGETQTIKLNFYSLYGFLDCRIFPWGEVYIDGQFVGQTPFSKPLTLKPKNYLLTVKNPNFGEINEEITINKSDTLIYKLNFELVVKKSKGE